VICILLTALFGRSGAAPVPVEPQPETELPDLFDRVRTVTRAQDWQREDWTDPQLEQRLEKLVSAVADATGGNATAKLPVKFADVRHRPAERRPGAIEQLVVSDNVNLSRAERSIILSDGNVRISFANDCLIVARGAVNVSHGRRNVIVAGHFIHTSHDGRSQPMRGAVAGGGMPAMQVVEPGSLLISGLAVDVSHAHGSIVVAPSLVRISHANGCSFINSPRREIGHNNGCAEFADDKFPHISAPQHALGAEISITWIQPRKGAVFTYRDRRYVAEIDKPIVDEAGQPVVALEGWTITYVDEGFVLFSKGGDFAGVVARSPG
jgi:hypothetical protein